SKNYRPFPLLIQCEALFHTLAYYTGRIGDGMVSSLADRGAKGESLRSVHAGRVQEKKFLTLFDFR
ncbi:MAG: hypothetical protein O7F71_05515, partial [Gammaproteobacteria bacterium]|nr:hypothetical protein [Gammaproteobacteria bacterium]